MHHITIRDQVCNVMASLTKTFLSVPRLSCKTLKRSLLADYLTAVACHSAWSGPLALCCKTMSPRRASAPCQREVSLDRLLEVAQLEVVARMLLDRIQELVIQPCECLEAGTVSSPPR